MEVQLTKGINERSSNVFFSNSIRQHLNPILHKKKMMVRPLELTANTIL